MSLGVALAALSIGGLAPGASAQPLLLRDIPKVARPASSSGEHVYYHGGAVLHSNRTHLVFWQPRGSGLGFGPGYVSLIQGFLRNVAAASHSASNVFGLTGQYTDSTGRPAVYASHYGGSVLDTDPLPANGCVEPPTGPLWPHCLTDSQLRAELEHVVRRHRLPHGPDDVYFLVTPRGLASCMDTSSSCSLGGPLNGYCGYHGVTKNTRLLYAVIPFNAIRGHCQSDNPRPNHNPADPALSTISHELSEMITDPYGTAWSDSSGMEIGDICLTRYGASRGGSGNGRYDESINRGHYYLQEEWSNAGHSCLARAHRDRVSFSVVSQAGRTVELRAMARDPQGRIRSYRWSFGDGTTGRGRDRSHSYRHPGIYHVLLRVVDSWENYAYAGAVVRIARGG